MARELVEVEIDDHAYKFQMHGLVTNANYSNKRMVMLLFINNRLVDSSCKTFLFSLRVNLFYFVDFSLDLHIRTPISAIRKMLEELYCLYLPKKAHPWCYVSLNIDPQNIDVNVHPTKHEVRFLHEDAIIERIKSALDERLAGNSASRTFYLQARLPKADITKEILEEVLPEYDKGNANKLRKVYQKDLVRTDSSDRKLDRFNFTCTAFQQDANKRLDTTAKESSRNVRLNSELNIPLETDASAAITGNPPADGTRDRERDSNLNSKEEDDSSLQKTPARDGSVHWSDMVDTRTDTSTDTSRNTCNPVAPAQSDKQDVRLESNTDFDVSEFLQDLEETADSPAAEDLVTDTVAEKALKQVYQYFGNRDIIDRKANAGEEQRQNTTLRDANEDRKEAESSVSDATRPDSVPPTASNTSADESPRRSGNQFKSYSMNSFRHEVKLTSILQLRREVEDECHEGLRNVLANLTFVGCIDRNSALIQSGVNLYICNTRKLA